MRTARHVEERPEFPIWPLILLVLLTLTPLAVIIHSASQDSPAGMPLMEAINSPTIGGGTKVYAIIIGMLLWLVTVPMTTLYGIMLTIDRLSILNRRRRAQKRGEII